MRLYFLFIFSIFLRRFIRRSECQVWDVLGEGQDPQSAYYGNSKKAKLLGAPQIILCRFPRADWLEIKSFGRTYDHVQYYLEAHKWKLIGGNLNIGATIIWKVVLSSYHSAVYTHVAVITVTRLYVFLGSALLRQRIRLLNAGIRGVETQLTGAWWIMRRSVQNPGFGNPLTRYYVLRKLNFWLVISWNLKHNSGLEWVERYV